MQKNTCKHCPNRNKCYKGKIEWKEIDFTKDNLQKPSKDWVKAEGDEPADVFVRASIWNYKTRHGSHIFSAKRDTVAGEFALFCLRYNLERAKNLLGFQKMMEMMEQA